MCLFYLFCLFISQIAYPSRKHWQNAGKQTGCQSIIGLIQTLNLPDLHIFGKTATPQDIINIPHKAKVAE